MVWAGAIVQYPYYGPIGALFRGSVQFLQSSVHNENCTDVGRSDDWPH